MHGFREQIGTSLKRPIFLKRRKCAKEPDNTFSLTNLFLLNIEDDTDILEGVRGNSSFAVLMFKQPPPTMKRYRNCSKKAVTDNRNTCLQNHYHIGLSGFVRLRSRKPSVFFPFSG